MWIVWPELHYFDLLQNNAIQQTDDKLKFYVQQIQVVVQVHKVESLQYFRMLYATRDAI